MTDSQCPHCKAHLGKKLECVECGWQSAPPSPEENKYKAEMVPGLNERAPSGVADQVAGQTDSKAVGETKPEENQQSPAARSSRHLRPARPGPETSLRPESGKKNQSPGDTNAVPAKEKKAGPPEEKIEDDTPHPTPHPPIGAPSSPIDVKDTQFVNYKGDPNLIGKKLIQRMHKHFNRLEDALKGMSAFAKYGDGAEYSQGQGQRSQSRDSTVEITGHGNTYGHNVTVISAPPNHQRGEPKPLKEFTTTLYVKPPNVPGNQAFSPAEVKTFKEQPLVFISSAGERVALGAAYCLIAEMGIEGEEQRLLDFESVAWAESNLSSQLFTQAMAETGKPLTAVVVDGLNDKARVFLDWLVSTPSETNARKICKQLKDNRLVLLCMVDEGYISSRFGKSSPTFPVWEVPFLRPLLKHSFSEEYIELEQTIRKQQREGKWEKTDKGLYRDILPYLDRDELLRKLEPGASTGCATDNSEAPLFTGSQPIEDTLLYVASYFVDLAPHEFDQVVTALIGDKTTTVTVKSLKKNKDGETEVIETEIEKPLVDFWDADPDKYLMACQLQAVAARDSTTVIDFADARWREEGKARLERKYSLYLMRQFRAIDKQRLLFNSTPAITANVMRLSIDMAIAHPDSFGRNWLFKLLTEETADGERKLSGADGSTNFDGAKGFSTNVHKRITQLLRKMLERPQLEETVSGLLKELMSAGAHDSVIYIVKGLQFAPRFDEFLWMKRLLDEGDERMRNATYYHLYGYIKKIGIYPLLNNLDTWLPDVERMPETYSWSTTSALRLLVEYCSETVEGFDPRYYGSPQPLHPFLILDDEISARENVGRLIKWLLHPGMEIVFSDLDSAFDETESDNHVISFVCEIVVVLMFVLKGRGAGSLEGTLGETEPVDEGSVISAATVRDILIEEMAKATRTAQRDEMLTYWEQMRDLMAFILRLRPDSIYAIELPDYQEREGIRWKRELVRELISHFRGAIRNLRNKPHSSVVAHAEQRAV